MKEGLARGVQENFTRSLIDCFLQLADPGRARRKVAIEGLENLDAALAKGCAFWDQRAKMGGKGSMREWVLAGMAQSDYVHLTAPGYHMIGDAMFRDLMSEYDLFVKAREALALAPNLDRP